MSVALKTPDEIARLRVAAGMAAELLVMIREHVRPGVTTNELDALCERYTTEVLRARSAPLGYHGFPKSICTSPNHVVCHGIPNDKPLKEGDIVNVDVTVIKDEYHGDSSAMFYVGEPSILARRLCETCYEALWVGIRSVRPGARLGDLGHAIQTYAEARDYSVVREYCGHGIGRSFHEEPQVLHYGIPGTGLELVPGMVFTIEPMLNAGRRHVKLLQDGWTVVTKDHALSAQWEHTVLVTETGVEVLTLRPGEQPPALSATP